jgi:hypothetical protein
VFTEAMIAEKTVAEVSEEIGVKLRYAWHKIINLT